MNMANPKLGVALAASLALTACGVARGGPDVTAQPAPPPVASGPIAAATSMPASTPEPKAPPQPPPATASLPQPSPDQLMGLDSQAVTRLLGPPGLKRNEGPAHVWQYANRLCVMDVVMYEDEGRREPRVTYFELRDPTGGSAVPRACFRSFLKTPPDGGA